MKKLKRILVFILIFSFGYITSIYLYPRFLNPNPYITKVETLDYPKPEIEPEISFAKAQKLLYTVDIPAKYFDPAETTPFIDETTILLGGDLEITTLPVAIERDNNIQAISEKYDHKKKLIMEFDNGDNTYGYDIDNDGEFETNIFEKEPIDVDNDGKLERIIYGSIAMTHQPHKVVIVKDGNIIYKSKYLGHIHISGSESKNGFYLSHEFDIGSFPYTGGYTKTRYIYEEGKFIPVWHRETYQLQTTKP